MILFCPLEEIGNTMFERQIENHLSTLYKDKIISTLYTQNYNVVQIFDLVYDADKIVVLVESRQPPYDISDKTFHILQMAHQLGKKICMTILEDYDYANGTIL